MKKFFLTIICNIFCLFALAEQDTLLAKYRNMAIQYNHSLKAAEKNIRVSLEMEKMARADLKPKLSANVEFQYTENPMQLMLHIPTLGSPLSFQGQHVQYGASLSLLQPVYTGGKLLNTIKLTESQQVVAENEAEIARTAVLYQTDIQYWSTVARYEMIGVSTDFRNSVAQLVDIIQNRVDVGLVDPQDLLMAEVKLNEADFQLLKVKNNFIVGQMALNALIGVDLHNRTTVDYEVPLVKISDSMLVKNGDRRPELRTAKEQITITKYRSQLDDAQFKPQLYVGVGGSYNSPGYNFRPDMDWNYAVYAQLSVPIFEWGKRRSQKRMGEQHVGMATDYLNQVTDEVNTEIETARIALLQALQRVRLSTSSLEKARENEQKALERYTEGKISVLETLDAQTYRLNSQLNYIQAKAEAQGYYSGLLKAINEY